MHETAANNGSGRVTARTSGILPIWCERMQSIRVQTVEKSLGDHLGDSTKKNSALISLRCNSIHWKGGLISDSPYLENSCSIPGFRKRTLLDRFTMQKGLEICKFK